MAIHLSPPDPQRAPAYPWEQWLDGREWTLAKGRDFWGDTHVMLNRVRRAASRRGLRVVLGQPLPGFLTFKTEPRVSSPAGPDGGGVA